MDYLRLLEFQVDRLGYQFKNVDHLQQALTHSVETKSILIGLPNQNRSFQRLQIIGSAVIKYAISRYVVQTSDGSDQKEELSVRMENLMNVDVQKKVGEMFFEPYTTPEFENLFNYLRMYKELQMKGKIPYQTVIRALMGAVYLDAGGASGGGLEEAFKLFGRIWEGKLDKKNGMEFGGTIKTSFPPPSAQILEIWRRHDFDEKFKMVEGHIGVKITKRHLLGIALVENAHKRLKLLGNSVLELVITEHLWLEYPFPQVDFFVYGPLENQIKSMMSSKSKEEIFSKLGLDEVVKIEADGTTAGRSNKQSDIVESIVGAVYVDGGGTFVKEFITKHWNLLNTLREPKLDDLEEKLGYKFQKKEFLIRALSHPDGILNGQFSLEDDAGRSKELREVLKYFGTSWILFHATDYILRTCDPADSITALVFRRNNLCGEGILLRIGSYLNLSKYVGLSMDQINRGMEPYMLYQDIIETIAGAIFKDMQEAKIKINFGRIFYRLWNPFLLKKCRNEDLIKSFPSGLVGGTKHAIGESKLKVFQTDLLHYFKNQYILEEAIIPIPLGKIRNNPRRLSLLGETILDLAVRVYVTIDCYGALKDQESAPKGSDFHCVHSRILEKCLDDAYAKYEAGLVPWTGCGEDFDDELIKRLFGAVFVDMWEKNADMTFAEWKNYITLRCKFIN